MKKLLYLIAALAAVFVWHPTASGMVVIGAAGMLVWKTPDWQNVAANGVATCNFPLGKTYERISMVLGGGSFTKAMVTDIKLKMNGKLFYQISGARLDSCNQQRGLPTGAANLDIDFTERDAKAIEGQLLGTVAACPEAGVQAFTAEVTIAGATTPTLTGYVQTSEPSSNRVITRVLQNQYAIAGAVTQEIYIPYGPQSGGQLKRVNIFHTGNVTSLEVRKNNIPVWDSLPAAYVTWLFSNYRKITQSNVFTYDAIYDNLTSNMLNTKGDQSNPVNALQFKVTTSGADTLNVITEYLDTNANL